MDRLLIGLVIILTLCWSLKGSNADDYYYYDNYYDDEAERNVPKPIPIQQVKDIENATQVTLIRLIRRANRLTSKALDDASVKCSEKTAQFEEMCKSCGGKEQDFLAKVLKFTSELMKVHPIYWHIKIGEKVFKEFKRIRIRKIIRKVGKTAKQLGENIGKAWRKMSKGVYKLGRRIGKNVNRFVRRVGRNLNRIARRLGRNLNRVARRLGRNLNRFTRRLGRQIHRTVRRIRIKVPRVRLPRVRLPRIRVKLPRIRIRVPRFRFRWGKKKRSSCGECERIGNIKDEKAQTNALVHKVCPFMAVVNKEGLKTGEVLKKLIPEIENGFPRVEKILHHHYLESDEAEVTLSLREGKQTYKLKNFRQLSTTQAGRILGRYIFQKAKQ